MNNLSLSMLMLGPMGANTDNFTPELRILTRSCLNLNQFFLVTVLMLLGHEDNAFLVVVISSSCCNLHVLINLFGILRCFQHCIGHITKGSWKGRGNQYIQFIRVLYCKLPTNGKQLPASQLEAVLETKPQPQRWEAKCYHSATVAPRMSL